MLAANGDTKFRARQVVANGLRFRVIDEGQGPAVLLLHGFPDTSYLWRHQIPALVAAGYRALAPDLRGRGETEMPTRVEDYGLRLMVQDVAALLDALSVERAHVIGHDWGAALAWLVASLLPQRVDHLVVISVGHPATRSQPTLDQLQKGWYQLLFQFEGTAEKHLQQDDWYLLKELGQGAGDQELYMADLTKPGALTAALNWYRANLSPERLLSSPPALPKVQAPTLGIWSSGDLYLTEDRMLRSAAYVSGHWEYVRIEDASHWIPLDQPARLNRLSLEFLASSGT